MKATQFTHGKSRRVMYIENKDGLIDTHSARIGWVTFSKTGRTVYYHDKQLLRQKGGGVRGNFRDVNTNEEYWISGPKKTGSNTHWAESVRVAIDDDAREEYIRIKESVK